MTCDEGTFATCADLFFTLQAAQHCYTVGLDSKCGFIEKANDFMELMEFIITQ